MKLLSPNVNRIQNVSTWTCLIYGFISNIYYTVLKKELFHFKYIIFILEKGTVSFYYLYYNI